MADLWATEELPGVDWTDTPPARIPPPVDRWHTLTRRPATPTIETVPTGEYL